MENNAFPQTIDEYIAGFPANVQTILSKMRSVIRQAAPEASEKISYRMPTFTFYGNLVHFAAFKQHIGFYPTPSAIEIFKDKLTSYKTAKGSIRFPMDRPLPVHLIQDMVKFRVSENMVKFKAKNLHCPQ